MSSDRLFGLAAVFAPLSLLAVGGANAVIPEMQRQLVGGRGWLTGPELATLVAAAHARRQLLERPAREPTGLSGRRLRGATVAHTAAGQTSDTAVQYVRMTTTSAPARGDRTTLDAPPLEDRR